MAGGVELEIADAEHRRACGDRSAKQGANPRGELAERNRLDDEVIRTVVEAADALRELVSRREHQDPRPRRVVRSLAGAEGAGDLAPVDARQAEVEADEVVRVDPGLQQRVLAVVRDVDRVALLPEPVGERVGEVVLVLDDEETHLQSV